MSKKKFKFWLLEVGIYLVIGAWRLVIVIISYGSTLCRVEGR
jgi:hypothetical protein